MAHDSGRDALLGKGADGVVRTSSFELGSSDEEPMNGNVKPGPRRRANGSQSKGDYILVDESKSPLAEATGLESLGALSRRWGSIAVVTLLAVLLTAGGGGFWMYKKAPPDGQSPPWYPTPPGGTVKSWEKSYEQARDVVSKMTLIEKVNVTTGVGWSMDMCVGNTGSALAAGFPSLCLQDGPLGVRFTDKITAFPAGITTGATWNRALIRKRGAAHAREARLKGINVLLGPAMGPLGRQPASGRAWEGFGSDPVLQGIAAAETIHGIQGEGVMATAKHFVGNEQEHFRQSFEWGLPNAMSSNIDDRTLHEVYAWPFADSIRAGVASIMCSYQQVNNSYACANSKLMNGILKDEMGFQGFIQSDWLAQRSGVAAALSGLDMSMPGDGLRWGDGKSLWGKQLTLSVLNGSVPMDRLNDMATRIVASWYQMGQQEWERPRPEGEGGPNFSSWTDDHEASPHPGSDDTDTRIVNYNVDARVAKEGEDAHDLIARQVAAEGTVLVKNVDNALPLARNGLQNGKKLRVGIYGSDAGPTVACPDRGCNQGTLVMGWGSGAVDLDHHCDPYSAIKQAFDTNTVDLATSLTNDVSSAEKTLHDRDVCIAFGNAHAGEGYMSLSKIHGDRNDLNIQNGAEELIQSVAQKCGGGKGKTIVVIHSVGPVILENWIDEPTVKGVLLANLPGQESGNALVDVMFGDVDASGRLPYTVGKSAADYGTGAQIMYYPNGVVPQADFDEGLYIDYRHFDKQNIAPRYEFGYGLSYSSFKLSDLKITPLAKKTALPSPRPKAESIAPTYDTSIPDPSTAVFPEGFRVLSKYVYPYITSVAEVKTDKKYPYPDGWSTVPHEPSPAGGAEGGNPSLYEPLVKVSFTVKNTDLKGTNTRDGQTVAQLYVSFPSGVKDVNGDAIDFPVRVLRNFEKLSLKAGESRKVEMVLTRRDLSYWSVVQQNWVMPTPAQTRSSGDSAKFGFWVGHSSRDLPLSGTW